MSQVKNRKVLIMMLLLVMTLLVTTSCGYSQAKKQKEVYKEAVLEHLKNKYGEVFVIINSRYPGHDLGYLFTVSPKANRKIYFDASIEKTGEKPTGYLTDKYSIARLNYEFREFMRPKLSKFFKSKYYIGGTVNFDKELKERLYAKKVDYDKVNFEYLIKNEPEHLSSLSLFMIYFKDITEENKEELMKEIYEYIIYIKSLGVKGGSLELIICEERGLEETDFDELAKKKDYSGLSMYAFQKDYIRYSLFIEGDQFNRISTLEDLSDLEFNYVQKKEKENN